VGSNPTIGFPLCEFTVCLDLEGLGRIHLSPNVESSFQVKEDRSMKRKMIAAGLLVVGCLVFLVAKAISQPSPSSSPPAKAVDASSLTPLPPASTTSLPTSVSPPVQSPGPQHIAPTPSVAPSGTEPAPNFAAVGRDGASRAPTQDWTFERLSEELRRVRYRQKELREQEAHLLVKMAEKVEEKRRDYNKAQEELRQLKGDQGLTAPTFGSQTESRPDPVTRDKTIPAGK
jgi:hypothetical protein